jgi:hypothetical protein
MIACATRRAADSLRQRPDRLHHAILEARRFHGRDDLLSPVAERDAAHRGHHVEVLLHQHLAIQRSALRQIPDAPLRRDRIADHVDAVDLDVAAVGLEVAGENLHQRRLAGAVRPQEPDHLALRDLETHAGERSDMPVALG